MPARVSESIVLRTYPLREADLVVSFFTRDQGKLRGVANRARKLKSNFGSGLERLSHVEMAYNQRENRELVNLNSCELIHSQFQLAGEYAAGVALDYLSEVSEQLLPAGEPDEKFFRLLLAMLDHLRREGDKGVWCAVTYFSLWAVRLSGFLPDLKLGRENREIAEDMLRKPISELAGREWSKQTAVQLRRLLVGQIEEHVERRMKTAEYLEAL
jgi:DNA repair protein RecO (recombination protein O)